MKPNEVTSADRVARPVCICDSVARTAEMPEDFLTALAGEPDAKAFFDTLNKTQRYGFFFRITTAKKTETRSKRIADFVTMLKRGEKLR